jgi:hypothetical protein
MNNNKEFHFFTQVTIISIGYAFSCLNDFLTGISKGSNMQILSGSFGFVASVSLAVEACSRAITEFNKIT